MKVNNESKIPPVLKQQLHKLIRRCKTSAVAARGSGCHVELQMLLESGYLIHTQLRTALCQRKSSPSLQSVYLLISDAVVKWDTHLRDAKVTDHNLILLMELIALVAMLQEVCLLITPPEMV